MPISNQKVLSEIRETVRSEMQSVKEMLLPWLTQAQAKRYIDVKDDKTMKRYREEMGLPYSFIKGQYRYHRDDLDAWMRSQREDAA